MQSLNAFSQRLACLGAIVAICLISPPATAFDESVEQRIDKVVSIFENGTPTIQYSYISALGDGRGYTAGRAGFTTATGDLVTVLKRYATKRPVTPEWPELELLIPTLQRLADQQSSDISLLTRLPFLWRKSAEDPKFRASQNEINDSLYRNPARETCRRLKLPSALSLLVIYDSIVQHGDGDDEDGLKALIRRSGPASNERTFITSFLHVRRADLLNPSNPGTTVEWRDSVGRVDALEELVTAGHWALETPFILNVWNSHFSL